MCGRLYSGKQRQPVGGGCDGWRAWLAAGCMFMKASRASARAIREVGLFMTEGMCGLGMSEGGWGGGAAVTMVKYGVVRGVVGGVVAR